MSSVSRFAGQQDEIKGRLDPYSDTWTYVLCWAERELKEAREANDSVKLSEAQTMALRGRIKALKALLSLPDPPKERLRTPPED